MPVVPFVLVLVVAVAAVEAAFVAVASGPTAADNWMAWEVVVRIDPIVMEVVADVAAESSWAVVAVVAGRLQRNLVEERNHKRDPRHHRHRSGTDCLQTRLP